MGQIDPMKSLCCLRVLLLHLSWTTGLLVYLRDLSKVGVGLIKHGPCAKWQAQGWCDLKTTQSLKSTFCFFKSTAPGLHMAPQAAPPPCLPCTQTTRHACHKLRRRCDVTTCR